MHSLTVSHRHTDDDQPSKSIGTGSASDSSLLPVEWQTSQLFRTRTSLDETATVYHLPRIVWQLVNGYMSLKEIGLVAPTCRDIYATCAFFRCPLNTVNGGIRQRWLVLGQEFSRARLRLLLRSPLRIHVSICELSDPRGGLLKQGDMELMRSLPFLTDLHAHYKFSQPFDWAGEIQKLVERRQEESKEDSEASSSSSSLPSAPPPLLRTSSLKLATLPPFKSLVLCPHDPNVDGEDEEYEEGEEGEMKSSASYGYDESGLVASSSDPYHPKNLRVFNGANQKPKPKMSQAEMLKEEERLVAEEKEHLAAWTKYNEKLYEMIPLFASLETLGLNLIGESTNWRVDGFSELSNLRTLELEVESPWNFAFARQITQIIEFIRDVPYKHLRKFQSNALSFKHLKQLVRPRRPSDLSQDPPPVLSTLWSFKVYGHEGLSGIPPYVRPQVDAWETAQNEQFIIPFVKIDPDEEESKYQKRLKRACAPATADEMLELYSHLPLLRSIDLFGFSLPLTEYGLARLSSLVELDTLGVGGTHASQLLQDDGLTLYDITSDAFTPEVQQEVVKKAVPMLNDTWVAALTKVAKKEIGIERLTLSCLTQEGTSTEENPWTPSVPERPTPMHEILFAFSHSLLELELNMLAGVTDLTAVAQCTKLLGIKLVGLRGFKPTVESIGVLKPLTKLKSLRISGMVLPQPLIDALMIPSSLLPSIQDFAAEAPRFAVIGPDGQPMPMDGLNFDMANLNLDAFNGMGMDFGQLQAMPQFQLLAEQIANQLAGHPHFGDGNGDAHGPPGQGQAPAPHAAAPGGLAGLLQGFAGMLGLNGPAGGAAAAAAVPEAAPSIGGTLPLGPLYAQLYNQMVQEHPTGMDNNDLPELYDEAENEAEHKENESEDDEEEQGWTDSVD